MNCRAEEQTAFMETAPTFWSMNSFDSETAALCMLTMIQQLHHAHQLANGIFGSLWAATFRDSSTWIKGGVCAPSKSASMNHSRPRAREQWRQIESVLQTRALKSCNQPRNSGKAQLTLQDIISDWNIPIRDRFYLKRLSNLISSRDRSRRTRRSDHGVHVNLKTTTFETRAAAEADRTRSDPSINVPALTDDTVRRLNELDAQTGSVEALDLITDGTTPKP